MNGYCLFFNIRCSSLFQNKVFVETTVGLQQNDGHKSNGKTAAILHKPGGYCKTAAGNNTDVNRKTAWGNVLGTAGRLTFQLMFPNTTRAAATAGIPASKFDRRIPRPPVLHAECAHPCLPIRISWLGWVVNIFTSKNIPPLRTMANIYYNVGI